ncbi:MAG: M20/M25/M40 family metallo-hydrolase [Gemmatimonadaceae bacterium]|nr:M20/M25/M40 family metallo-hydrolase [Gemmatimonadaceae bacterium]
MPNLQRLRSAAPAALLALCLTAGVAPLSGQVLSPAEQKMRAYVHQHVADQTAFLEKVVNISSGTMNHAGVRATGDAFAAELKALGFETRWVGMPPEMKRAGHLFAEHRARKGRGAKTGMTVLLLGHLDTVFEGESQRYTLIDDSTAKGAGTGDMKGGDVVFLYALKAMAAAGTLADANIIVALMGDEESGGEPDSVSRRDLVEAAKRSQAILAFEEDAGKATIARRGFSSWQVAVTARQGHSAGVFSKGSGYGAIYEVARILDEFREALSSEPNLTFNPGVIVGGTTVTFDSSTLSGTTAGKLNIIAPSAFVEGDLRFLTADQLNSARAKMTGIVSMSLPGTSSKITFADGNPSMPPTPGNYALLAVLDSVTRALGQGPTEALDPGQRGAGDISYVAQYADALDGLGVNGSRSHTPDETVNLKSLPIATERAAVLINRLVHRKR